MKEQLISFETAKLAKEKGFDIPVEYGYSRTSKKASSHFDYAKSYDTSLLENHNQYKGVNKNISAPTQSLLQKWLREKHDIHININTFYFTDIEKFGYEVEDILYDDGALILCGTQGKYEEALEVGLQEALKLIEV